MKDMSEETRQKLSDSMKAVWRQRRKAKQDADAHKEAVKRYNDQYREEHGPKIVRLYEAARSYASEETLHDLFAEHLTSEVMVHGMVSGKGTSDKHDIIVSNLRQIIVDGMDNDE